MQQLLIRSSHSARRFGWALLLTLVGQCSLNPPAHAQPQPQVLFAVSAATLKSGYMAPGPQRGRMPSQEGR